MRSDNEIRIIKMLFKKLGKAIVTIVKSIVQLVYFIIRTINNTFALLFNKLPRIGKVIVIYLLIIGCICNFIPRVQTLTIEQEIKQEITIVEEPAETQVETPQVEVKETQSDVSACQLDNENACQIYNTAIANGLTKEQSVLLIAISAHETGYWKSDAFKNRNNYGGIMSSSTGQIKIYESKQEGLNGFVNLLKTKYFGRGLNTIEQIGNVYCPVGADNDSGHNKDWIPSVTNLYNKYLSQVK